MDIQNLIHQDIKLIMKYLIFKSTKIVITKFSSYFTKSNIKYYLNDYIVIVFI